MNFFNSCLGILLTTILSLVLVVSLLVGILGGSSSIPDQAILQLSLDGKIVDHDAGGALSDMLDKDRSVSLEDVLNALRLAKDDERVKGVSIRINSMGASYAAAEEIRKALADFKESGKFVYAYSGLYSQGAYYLSTAADSIFLNPEGSLDFSGISSSSLFFKGFLDKLGVEMQVVRCGAYKSYAESFANDTMSAENREQMGELISSIWESVLDNVSLSRGVSQEELKALADEYMVVKPASYLLEKRLVDGVVYGEEYQNVIRERLSIPSDEELPLVGVEEYLDSESSRLLSSSPDQIALVYLSGEIDNGNTDGISSSRTVKLLWDLDKDPNVKAIVLRVNSPGGSAYGSEQICHVVQKVKKHKPIVASFGGCAASGGYYLASNADMIFSDHTTITGSIGVIAMVPNAKDLADKLGVHYETVKTNTNADLMENVFRPMSERERKAVQASVDRFYSTFLQRCSEGRDMPVEEIHQYAQGRVWSGDDAKELNLVDSIGTLDDAIHEAAFMAGLNGYALETYPKKRGFWEQLEEIPAIGYEKLFGNDVFSKEKYIFEKIRNLERVQAIIPYTIELR